MNYGTKALQQYNTQHAKPGDVVVLGPTARSDLKSTVGVDAERATLTRQHPDGLWFADFNGAEWCIGSGFDWKLAQQDSRSQAKH